jgi:hypothetical protein
MTSKSQGGLLDVVACVKSEDAFADTCFINQKVFVHLTSIFFNI